MAKLEVTSDLLTNIGRLPIAKRNQALKLLGKVEWDKCAKDIFYWLDATRHAIPYVYTLDPHPMYTCRICQTVNTYKFSELHRHLKIRHDLDKLTDQQMKVQFDELPTTRPFTLHPYMVPIIEWWLREPLMCIEKSRDMMATWLVVTMYSWDTFFHYGRENIFQSDDSTKTAELVKRAEFLWKSQPKFLRDQHKFVFGLGQTRSGMFICDEMDSKILGFPQGPDQIRQYHPSGVMIDEAAFQIEAGEAFAAIKPSIQNGGRCTMVSTANPSYFMHLCRDTSDTMIEG